MATLDDYEGRAPTWCPGCGNFGILKAFKQAVVELGWEPHQFTIVSGIGQSGKFPHYTRCNTFNGLHGRTLPVATALRLVNHTMPVLAFAGDGDCYGEGGNHFIHAVRRNVNVKLFVHDNQIYGLTKGQASPTSTEGTVSKVQPFGSARPLNPVALAIALDCSFVARGFAGDGEQLKDLMKEALTHRGFSLLDIFQPCVTFNKLNTYDWYRSRCYHLGPDYDPEDRSAAFQKALEFGDRIPTGVIYRLGRPVFEDHFPMLGDTPLSAQPFDTSLPARTVREFY